MHGEALYLASFDQIGLLAKWIVCKAGLRASGKGISPHWFRHAHAGHAIDRGAPVILVQQTLGHADLRTTSHYDHARPNDSSSLYLPVK